MIVLHVISILLLFTSSQGFVFQPKIVNGYPSNPTDFPFYVHLTSVDKSARHLGDCGATLISDRYFHVISSIKSTANLITPHISTNSSVVLKNTVIVIYVDGL